MAEIIGIDKLINDLKKVDKVQASTLKKLVKQSASPILSQAKSKAPVGETGNLRDSLELQFERTRKSTKQVIRIISKDGIATTKYKGRDVSYFFFATGKRKNGNHGTTDGNTFAQQALKDNYQNTLDNLEKPLLEAFDKVMKETGKVF